MSTGSAASPSAAAARAATTAAEAEVLDWAPPLPADVQSGDEEEEIITGFISPAPGISGAAGGTHAATQTEAHVFISTFAAGASDGELAAAVGALSAVDLARLMAACAAAQPTAGPSTPAISSPSSSSGITPPTGTTLSATPPPLTALSASSTAPPDAGPAEAWLAPPGAQSSVVPGPSAAEARQYWTDQEAMHQVAEPATAANIAVPEDDDADLEGESGLDAYLAGLSGAVPKAPPDTTVPLPFEALCPAGAYVRPKRGLAPPPPPPPSLKIARGYVLYETYMYLIKSCICLARGYILLLSMYK
ncbi:unnamed protein product [Symbiodinium sp. CCMP2592]|nr:unnamed protein product [Symbiodinium sp. CCMP2592]